MVWGKCAVVGVVSQKAEQGVNCGHGFPDCVSHMVPANYLTYPPNSTLKKRLSSKEMLKAKNLTKSSVLAIIRGKRRKREFKVSGPQPTTKTCVVGAYAHLH